MGIEGKGQQINCDIWSKSRSAQLCNIILPNRTSAMGKKCSLRFDISRRCEVPSTRFKIQQRAVNTCKSFAENDSHDCFNKSDISSHAKVPNEIELCLPSNSKRGEDSLS